MLTMESTNPYESPKYVAAEIDGATHGTIRHGVWFAIMIATAVVWALFPIEELRLRRVVQRSMPLGMAFMCAPAIGWELLCRRTPRPEKRLDSISSSFLRCMFIYFWAFLIADFIFSSFAGPTWSNGDSPMTPAMEVMYAKHGFANACTVLFASIVLVMYDHLRSRKSKQRTEQGDEREPV